MTLAVSARTGISDPHPAHHDRSPVLRPWRHTVAVATASTVPSGASAALATGSTGLTALVAMGTAGCVLLAGVMI